MKIGAMNLHGTNETQRSYILNLAKKLGGYISIGDIANDLGVTHKTINGNYSRLICHYSDKENDFRKIIEEVPFVSGAVYQLVTEPPPSPEELIRIELREQEIYKRTTGVFYSVHLSPKLNPQVPLVAWLNLTKLDNLKTYIDMLPEDIRGDFYFSTKAKSRGPKEDDTIPVYTKDNWKEFINL
jgi:hypothetical protein